MKGGGSRRRRGRGGHALDLTVGGPHAVQAALEHGEDVERVFIEANTTGPRIDWIREAAARKGVPVSTIGRAECDRLCGTRAQGVAAKTRFRYADFDDLLTAEPGLMLVLDGVEDPQNLGAIIRTAEAAGCLGVVIPPRRSAQITAAVVRASAGAALYLPIAQPVNLSAALQKAREAGFWTIGLDHRAERLLAAAKPGERTALVIGGEGRGLARLVRETCDDLARIPMTGAVESLNASAAAAVAIYRIRASSLFGSAC